MDGQARLLYATLQKAGWTQLLALEFVYFLAIGLAPETDDATIWHYAQANGMLILTNNRNSDGETSLAATIARENTATSLPVVTIGNLERMTESQYREEVALGLVGILLYLENFLGTGRQFIP